MQVDSTFSLNKEYSTTRLVTNEEPIIVNNPEDEFETVLSLPVGENRQGEGGLRTKGYFKKSYDDKPLISIITVVYNGEKYLEETIQSVINQTYDNVEYIIIDGGSTDGTVDIIKKYEERIDYWVSERDKGIYDAMNKGIDVASGEWINFMNSGDSFYTTDVLNNIFNKLDKNYFLFYGNHFNKNKTDINKIKKPKFKLYSSIFNGASFSHQSIFVSLLFCKQNRFDIDYKIAADFKQFLNAYALDKVYFMDDDISVVDINGVSNINRIATIKEYEKIINKYYDSMIIFILFKISILYNQIKLLIKRVINVKG